MNVEWKKGSQNNLNAELPNGRVPSGQEVVASNQNAMTGRGNFQIMVLAFCGIIGGEVESVRSVGENERWCQVF